MPAIDTETKPPFSDPVEYLAEQIYAGYGVRAPWTMAHNDVRDLARKDAQRALEAIKLLAKLQAATTARLLGLTLEMEPRQ